MGKTAKSILISCGARLAVFDIQELREITAYDELELDTIGDRKTALFLIMICIAIYAVLVQTVAFTDDIIGSIWGVMGYTELFASRSSRPDPWRNPL